MTYHSVGGVSVGSRWDDEDEVYEIYVEGKFIGTALTVEGIRKVVWEHLAKNREVVKTIKVVVEDGAYEPARAHDTDAGLDLKSRDDDFWLWPGHSHVFDTGVHIEFPHGYYGKVESKSGLNVNESIVCLGGVIDEGYTGSIAVKVYNFGQEGHLFKKGDKVAQLVIQDYIAPRMEFVSSLEDTDRGESGFGSTGR